MVPKRAASSGIIPRPENTSRTTGRTIVDSGPDRLGELVDCRASALQGSPRRRRLQRGSSSRSAVKTAARACATGREANQVRIAFSLRPEPSGVPTARSTASHGNQRSIMRGRVASTSTVLPETGRRDLEPLDELRARAERAGGIFDPDRTPRLAAQSIDDVEPVFVSALERLRPLVLLEGHRVKGASCPFTSTSRCSPVARCRARRS